MGLYKTFPKKEQVIATIESLTAENRSLKRLLAATEQLQLAERVQELQDELIEALSLFVELRTNHPDFHIRGQRCGVSQLLPGEQTLILWDRVDAFIDSKVVTPAE